MTGAVRNVCCSTGLSLDGAIGQHTHAKTGSKFSDTFSFSLTLGGGVRMQAATASTPPRYNHRHHPLARTESCSPTASVKAILRVVVEVVENILEL